MVINCSFKQYSLITYRSIQLNIVSTQLTNQKDTLSVLPSLALGQEPSYS